MNYEKMVTDNLGLAHMMVRKYPLPRGYDYEDMYQEACIELFKASKEYDESKGFKFSTIATTCMANRFNKILRDQNAAKRTGTCISMHTQTVDDMELMDLLSDDSVMDPVDEAIASETLEILMEEEETIVRLRMGGMSQEDIGKEIGYSQVHVYRKLRKLKALVS